MISIEKFDRMMGKIHLVRSKFLLALQKEL